MWKVVIGLVVGVVIGLLLVNPIYGAKKNSRVVEDTDGDGIVEASIALFEYRGVYEGSLTHICCGCKLVHTVDFMVYRTRLLQAPALFMKWEVNEKRTHMERVMEFGPSYRHSIDPFAAEYDRYKRTPAW